MLLNDAVVIHRRCKGWKAIKLNSVNKYLHRDLYIYLHQKIIFGVNKTRIFVSN